jgi:5-methyltetrahydropteroyltriglutamate--homocysteine methyltransferase
MKASRDRILTTHTGALHRPPDLEELYRKKFSGEPYEEAAIDARLTTAVAEIARWQADIGIDVIDDGEFSKSSFWSYARTRLQGVAARPLEPARLGRDDAFYRRAGQTASSASDRVRFAAFYADTEGPGGVSTPPSVIQFYMPVGTAHEPPANHVVEGPLKYKADELRRDIDNFTRALAGVACEEAFIPAVAPGMLATRYRNEYYKSEEEYYFAIAEALREEYRAITEAGFVLQIDDVSIPGRRRLLTGADGMPEFKKWAGLAVDALNHALSGISPDRVRYHMCWSSMNAPHTDDPPLAELADTLLKINAQAYQIEAANARHEHEYHVWEDIRLPDGKILMPGVICHATNVIEHPDYVAERILRYANLIGRANVIAATDCGLRGRVHPQIAEAKLEALVEGARIASKKLWRG